MMQFLTDGVPFYPALFGACALSGIFWPWPEDVPLIYAGMCISADRAGLVPTILIAIIAVAVRDVISFGIGRVVGDLLLERPFVIRLFGQKRLLRAQKLIDDHDARAVLAGRFFLGMRAPVFMVAGAMGVPLRRFLLWDALGLLIVIPLTLFLGATFGQPLLDGFLEVWHGTRWLAPAVAMGLIAWASLRFAKKRRQIASTAGTADVDDDDDDE